MSTRISAQKQALSLPVLLALLVINCTSTGSKNFKSEVTEGSTFNFTKNDRVSCDMTSHNALCLESGALTSTIRQSQPDSNFTANTVFADKAAVTNGDYARCVAEGQCMPNSYYRGKNPALSAATLPALGLPYEAAMQYCAWTGKRMATENELSLASATAGFSASGYPDRPTTGN